MSHHPTTAFANRVLQRVDDVLAGRNVSRPAVDAERDLLIVMRNHIGKDNAIYRRQLAELLDLHDREARWLVSDVRRVFGVLIGADRSGGGYFLASSVEEVQELVAPLKRQALSLLHIMRQLTGRHATREWFSQARIELDLDTEEQEADRAAA